MFDFPLISKEALIFSLESLTVLNKRAAARRAYPSRMSGAIDLIPMQLLCSPSRGGCFSAWTLAAAFALTGLRYLSI